MVAHLDGRQEDYVVTRTAPDWGGWTTIFKDLVNVREAQIVQSSAGKITLRVVRGRGYGSTDERKLRQETVKRIGGQSDQIEFSIDYVEALPRTASGKLRFVVSDANGGAPGNGRLIGPPGQAATVA